MNWSDYEAVWKRQELPVGAGADPAVLKTTFETKHRRMAGLLSVRDWAEAGAGVFVSVAFLGVWWHLGRAAWPIGIGVALIMGVTGTFLRERWRASRLRLGADAPLLAKVEADLTELRHQRHLLGRLGLWYFTPCLTAVAICGATLERLSSRRAPPGLWVDLLRNPVTLAWILALVGVTAAAIGMAWQANRRAIWKQIDPRIAELEKLRRDLLVGS